MVFGLNFSFRMQLSVAVPLYNFRWQIFKDTHREEVPSNETPVLIKSTNMDIWVVGTTNQLFTRGS